LKFKKFEQLFTDGKMPDEDISKKTKELENINNKIEDERRALV
jgi:ATP-binding cassette subfamily F protein uup